MQELYKLENKTIYDIDTTILYTSGFNYTNDAVSLINSNCVVITKDRRDANNIPNDFYGLFQVEELRNKKDLTKIDEIKLNILGNLNSDKKIFVFFNVLTYLDKDFVERIIRFLKLGKKRIINYTTEIEETLMLDYIIVIHDNKVIMEGKKELILREDKILKKLGFKLPLIVELSSGLKLYGLVDKIYFNNKELVDVLWK